MPDKAKEAVSTYAATESLFFLMRVDGILMPNKYKAIFRVYAAIFLFYSLFYMPLSFTKAIFFTKNLRNDLGVFLTTVQLGYNVYGGFIKVILLGVKMEQLQGTSTILAKLEERCLDDNEIIERIKMVKLGRQIVVVTMTFYVSYAFFNFLGSFINGRPPYSVYFPYIDYHNSRWEFYLACLLEFLMVIIACIQQTITDAYVSVFMCLLRTQVRILKLRVNKLCSDSTLSLKENVKHLSLCIKDHQTLLSLQQAVEPMIAITVFIQFSITGIMLGTTLINITIFSTSLSNRLGSCFYVAAVTVQSFPLCYFAQSLQNESAELANQIFHSNWVDQCPEYRKMLVLFMQRTQQLLEFTAGKLFPVNLSSFLSIAKFSFSLYTLLKNMDFGHKGKA